MKINKIKVKNNNTNYPIFIGNGSMNLLSKQIKLICPNTKKVALILDKNIPSREKKRIKKQLKNYIIYTKEYLPNENLKSFKEVNFLVEKLLENNFNRNDAIIAAGGGIIGDFSGFVASILKRGVNFINLPSTLLSQVDSAIGGKTGVNSKEGKNLIGSFYQPKLVISELSLLKSLPKRERICGFAEILKYSLIKDYKFFSWIEKNSEIILKGENTNILKYAVVKSCKTKIYFVNSDEKEKGERMILNFGHTFAHGIEAANRFSKRINHGEAVLIGMILATRLSVRKKLCSKLTLSRIDKIYKINNLPFDLKKFFEKKTFNNIVEYMKNDKKNTDNKINLILLKKIGKTTEPGKIKIKPMEMRSRLKKIS